ncbi:MAG: flavin reductase family protein [Burkholderiaceae bacterium]|nr:flavin reductase family protein [Burkholderiaceae bacterium]
MSLFSSVIEPSGYREALGHYASGIAVITSQLDGELLGFTCSSFCSVSMSPPLVSFSVMSDSASYPGIRQAGRFAVNILSDQQADISRQFARRGADKWDGVERLESPLGNPVIAGSLHWLDCRIHAEHVAGDHLIVVGEVTAMSSRKSVAARPLLYYQGQYRYLVAQQAW